MIKRLFGMHHLNITQGRWGSYSHKKHNAYDLAGSDSGIDYFKATCSLKVIGIHRFNRKNGTGFANTIMFYDEENDVTLAMSHMDTVTSNCYVGKIYKPGDIIYMEGTAGKATGNHIHLEIAYGFQVKKIQFGSGLYGLKNWINFEDFFYVDDSITITNCPYSIERKGKEGKEPMIELKKGYDLYKINGIKMGIYLLSEDEDMCMLSASQDGKEDWESLANIYHFDTNGKHVTAVINANMFDGGCGQHLGVEISETKQFIPHQGNYLAFYEYMDESDKNSFNYTMDDQFWLSKNEVKYAATPYMIINRFGQVLVSKGYDNAYNRKPNTRSFTAWLKDGRRIMGVSLTAVTPTELYSALKEVVYVLCVYDGGGSTQMLVEGKAPEGVKNSGRLLANVLCSYKRGKDFNSWAFEKTQKNPQKQDEKNQEANKIDSLSAEIEILKNKLANIKSIIEG